MAKTQNSVAPMRSIKVSERAHQQLRTLAAKYDARIWAIVDMAIVAFKVEEQRAKTTARNGRKGSGK